MTEAADPAGDASAGGAAVACGPPASARPQALILVKVVVAVTVAVVVVAEYRASFQPERTRLLRRSSPWTRRRSTGTSSMAKMILSCLPRSTSARCPSRPLLPALLPGDIPESGGLVVAVPSPILARQESEAADGGLLVKAVDGVNGHRGLVPPWPEFSARPGGHVRRVARIQRSSRVRLHLTFNLGLAGLASSSI